MQNNNLQFVIQTIRKIGRKGAHSLHFVKLTIIRTRSKLATGMNLKLNLTPDIDYETIRITIR